MKNNYNNILLAAGLILMATAARIVNAEMGLYNLVPIAALGLFSGAVVKDKKYAFLFAILAQLAADMYFELFTNTPGFYGISQIFTYVALVAVTFLGFYIKQPKALKVFGFTIGASIIFFVVSNFGYYAQGWNGYSWGGFVKTYVDAIAFYKQSDAGVAPILGRLFLPELLGSTLLFGAYYLLQQKVAGKMTKAKA